MNEKLEKENITEKSKLKISQTSSENKNILIGNKRERTKEEEIKEDTYNKKLCKYCKNIYELDILELNKTIQSQIIIDFLSKKIKDELFLKILKENIDNILKKEDKNIEIKNQIICFNCFLNIIISGGLEKLFTEEKENNFQSKDLINNDQNNLKQIVNIYSINLNMAINSLKSLKSKYSKTIETTNDVFENTAIRIMLSNNKEPFQELKKKMDNCKQNLEEVKEQFDILINELTKKEELKKFYIEGVLSNDDLSKNNLLKELKKLENEIEINTININGGMQLLNGNDKNNGMPDSILYNLDKIKNDII